METVTAVIFDLDGTLLNTLEDLAQSCNQALSLYNYPPRTIDEVRGFVGNGLGVLMEKALPQGKSNPHYTEALESLRDFYAKNWKNTTRPYDGVLSLISTLNERGIKTGIVSNKPDAQVKELVALYFKGLIDLCAAVGEKERDGIRRKPAPDSVFSVMDVLGASAAHTVYVGDSDVDIITAKNAGIPCISVCWGFRSRDFLLDHGATVFAEKPHDILGLVSSPESLALQTCAPLPYSDFSLEPKT